MMSDKKNKQTNTLSVNALTPLTNANWLVWTYIEKKKLSVKVMGFNHKYALAQDIHTAVYKKY